MLISYRESVARPISGKQVVFVRRSAKRVKENPCKTKVLGRARQDSNLRPSLFVVRQRGCGKLPNGAFMLRNPLARCPKVLQGAAHSPTDSPTAQEEHDEGSAG